jgi:Animal haem peroxidase
MSIDQDTGPSTPQIQAPRAPEQLVAAASTGHDLGYGRRSARGHGYELRGLSYVPLSRLHEGRFGRMFRLPPFVPSDERIAEIAALMLENTTGPAPELDNPTLPAGYTYLGQFIDHDLTFDTASSLDRQNDPDALTNFRSPRFDLDCIYGRGPVDDPFLYDKAAGGQKLLIGHHDDEDDLPRNTQDTALLGDPRNDENIFISQLQLTMLKFHNKVLDLVVGDPSLPQGSETDFEAAQRIVRWHYQWLVVHDFLRRVVGADMLGEVLDETGYSPRVERRYYQWQYDPFMPVEFSVAAYRFGHSMIRGRYKLNSFVPALPTFTDRPVSENPRSHFGGFRILPPFWTIEWARFVEVDPTPIGIDGPQPSRLIDSKLANVLAALPPEIGGSRPSLIDRNLTRGARLLLPSGQDVAAYMGAEVLSDAELELPGGGPAPLWYYILKEAQVQAQGHHLGQVGGRIVAEVFLGLLEKDQSSYLRNQPGWKPFLPSANEGDYAMPDLISFTGHGLDKISGPGGGSPGGPGGSGGPGGPDGPGAPGGPPAGP